jgi:ABC-type uncharacterized transport system substrate-binding protein
MRRRQFLTLVGGAAAAWPLGVKAQQQRTFPVIGALQPGLPGASENSVSTFERALAETGYFANRNVAILYRWAEGRLDRLPGLAADLVREQVSVLVANSSTAALAAKAATGTIPIVFSSGVDPVSLGLVASLNRPGGNVTGVHIFEAAMHAKQLGLLRELIPPADLIGVIFNPSNAAFETELNDLEQGARTVGQRIHVLKVANERDIDAAFVTLARLRVGAVLIGADPLFTAQREKIISLAAGHSLPAFYTRREFVEAGGLASYGIVSEEGVRWCGLYAGRILKGERPADLPVFQVTRFQFVINLKTAKTLGLEVPPMLSARADEIIE